MKPGWTVSPSSGVSPVSASLPKNPGIIRDSSRQSYNYTLNRKKEGSKSQPSAYSYPSSTSVSKRSSHTFANGECS